MNDVIIIGGGHAGTIVGKACVEAGLQVLIVEDCREIPQETSHDWTCGRGVISGPGLVAILDPATGDEKRIVQSKAIVIAVGRRDASDSPGNMLGITKLGALLTADKECIITDHKGRTGAKGIFAAGSIASGSTPDIVEELVRFCAPSLI